MSSSSESESEDENMAAIRSIAKSADAVIETQKIDAKTSSKKKRKERGAGDADGDAPLDGLQMKLRKILDGRLEKALAGSFFSPVDSDENCGKARKKEKKKSKTKGKNGSVAFEGDVRLFRRVAKGAPSILDTQSSIREKAEDVAPKISSRKAKRRKVKGELSEAEEKKLRKKSLAVLAIDTESILKNAESAKEKAKGNVVEVEEFSGDDVRPNGKKRKKKKKKKKKKSVTVEDGDNEEIVGG